MPLSRNQKSSLKVLKANSKDFIRASRNFQHYIMGRLEEAPSVIKLVKIRKQDLPDLLFLISTNCYCNFEEREKYLKNCSSPPDVQ